MMQKFDLTNNRNGQHLRLNCILRRAGELQTVHATNAVYKPCINNQLLILIVRVKITRYKNAETVKF